MLRHSAASVTIGHTWRWPSFSRAILVLAGGVLAIAVPIWLFGNQGVEPRSILALTGLSAVFVVLAAAGVGRKYFDLFEPFWPFLGFYFLEYWIKPVLIIGGWSNFQLPYIEYHNDAIYEAVLLSAVGLVAFGGGYFFRATDGLARSIPHLGWPWNLRRAKIALGIGVGLFGVLVWHFVEKGGFDLVYMYLNRAALNRLDGDLVFLVHLTAWITVGVAFGLYRMNARRGVLGLALLLLLIAVVMAGMAVFGARWSLLFIVLSLVVMSHYVVKRITIRTAAVVGVCVFIVGAAFGSYRASFDRADLGPQRIVSNLVTDIGGGYVDWDILVGIAGHYPQWREHYYGRLALESLYWLVPRRIWPSKPQWYGPGRIQNDLVPGMLTESDEGGFVGTSISLSTLGEGYADLGVAGVAAYAFICGLCWRFLYIFLRENRGALPAALVYAPLLVYLPMSFRGFSLPLLHSAIWFVGSYLVCAWLGRGRTHLLGQHQLIGRGI